MQTFRDDLRRGEAIEKDFLDRLLVSFKHATKSVGKNSRYDILIPELDAKVEVKFDPMSRETGNIVVEYFHNQPSGLHTTESDHWLFYDGVDEYWLTLTDLIGICASQSPTRIHGRGDRHPKWVYLVPIEVIRKNARQ